MLDRPLLPGRMAPPSDAAASEALRDQQQLLSSTHRTQGRPPTQSDRTALPAIADHPAWFRCADALAAPSPRGRHCSRYAKSRDSRRDWRKHPAACHSHALTRWTEAIRELANVLRAAPGDPLSPPAWFARSPGTWSPDATENLF